jgi:predicted RNA polymerase sigma factor
MAAAWRRGVLKRAVIELLRWCRHGINRALARLDADGSIILLEDQDRSLWDQTLIAEGLALIDKPLRHRRPGPYQVQARVAFDRAIALANTAAEAAHIRMQLDRLMREIKVTQ